MGGNVFKNDYDVIRLDKENYEKYLNEISDFLHELGIFKYFPTQAYYEKEDFGDMDIIVSQSPENKSLVLNYLKSNKYPYNQNGDVISFLYKNFQIDLIFVNDTYYNYSCHYFSWNDLGNLIGRLAKQLGFKHGHNGLWYIQRNGDRVIKEHLLSTSYLDILNILKLDKLKFREGFKNPQEIFDFIIASPFFNYEIFKLENLNHINRIRDRKRKTYNLFLIYLEDLNKKKAFTNRLKMTEKEKEDFVISQFPFIQKDINDNNIQIEINNIIKEKFNGKIIADLTNLEGKSIGVFITLFKSIYSQEWLYITEASEIKTEINKIFNLYYDTL